MKRIEWIDNVRTVAILAVIFIHVSYMVSNSYGTIPNSLWLTGLLFDGSSRFAVPLFVMISGSLLIPKKQEFFEFIKHRLSRILWPLLFWNLGYMIFDILSDYHSDGIITYNLNAFVTDLKHGSSGHLWFLYMLTGLYMVTPVIRQWIKTAKEKEIIFFLIVWSFTLFSWVPVIKDYLPNFDLRYFSGYLGYFILGWYFAYKKIDKIKRISWGIIFLLVGLTITNTGTYYISIKENSLSTTLFENLSPCILLLSLGIFLLLKESSIKSPRLKILSNIISRNSFGIYLVHIMVLRIITALGLKWNITHPVFSIPAIVIICFSISLCISAAVRKLPYGKYIMG